MKNILFLLNIPSPYRVKFLEELNQQMKTRVVYDKSFDKNRNNNWLRISSQSLESIYINRNILNMIKSLKWIHKSEIVILGGYSTKLSMFYILYFKIINKKFILNADGGFISNESKFRYYIKRFLISSADYWLSSGKETSKYLKHYGAEITSIFEYPFSSVTENDIRKIPENERKSIKNQLNIPYEKVVLFVGRFIESKGVEKFIEATYTSEQVGFYLIGGKPTKKYLQLSKGKKNIKFLEHIDKKQLEKYYEIADLFVFPTYKDVWGLVINEAMAKGVPVITTNKCIAGIEMIDSSRLGYIVPVSATGEDYRKIIKENINNYSFDQEAIIEKAKDYTIDKMVERHIEIFKIINKSK